MTVTINNKAVEVYTGVQLEEAFEAAVFENYYCTPHTMPFKLTAVAINCSFNGQEFKLAYDRRSGYIYASKTGIHCRQDIDRDDFRLFSRLVDNMQANDIQKDLSFIATDSTDYKRLIKKISVIS